MSLYPLQEMRESTLKDIYAPCAVKVRHVDENTRAERTVVRVRESSTGDIIVEVSPGVIIETTG